MRPDRYRWVALVGLLALSLAVAADEEGQPSIPEGAVEFAGHHYLLVDKVEDLSWAGSKKRCAEMGGTLVVIGSKEEADFIAKLCDGGYMYLGATDQETEGTWTWVDGTDWGFTNWMDGQPNDYGGSEDFLATYDDGEWVDVEGSGEAFWMPTGFICEWSR